MPGLQPLIWQAARPWVEKDGLSRHLDAESLSRGGRGRSISWGVKQDRRDHCVVPGPEHRPETEVGEDRQAACMKAGLAKGFGLQSCVGMAAMP